MKKLLVFVAVIIFVGFVATAQAEELAYAKNGAICVGDEIVNSIPGNGTPAIGCGANQNNPKAPAGNAWFKDPKMQKYWGSYALAKQGNYWCVKAPAAFIAVGYIEFNVAKLNGTQVSWAPIEKFQGAPWYGNGKIMLDLK